MRSSRWQRRFPSTSRRALRTPPDSRNRSLSVGACGCTSQRHKTHITESDAVRYRWHCWFGRAVAIDASVAKAGVKIHRCHLSESNSGRSLEIPQWMFDGAICSAMREGDSPIVDCEALIELREILVATSEQCTPSVIEASQRSSNQQRESNAQRSLPSSKPSARAVQPASDADIAEPASGGEARDHQAGGADATRGVQSTSRRRRRRGEAE